MTDLGGLAPMLAQGGVGALGWVCTAWLVFRIGSGALVSRAVYLAMLAQLEVRNAELITERDDWKAAAQTNAKQAGVVADEVGKTVIQMLQAAESRPHPTAGGSGPEEGR